MISFFGGVGIEIEILTDELELDSLELAPLLELDQCWNRFHYWNWFHKRKQLKKESFCHEKRHI